MNVKTIKRFLFVLMFLTALLCVACGKHTHEFGEWVVVTEATEEAEGLKERVCECGEKENGIVTGIGYDFGFVCRLHRRRHKPRG